MANTKKAKAKGKGNKPNGRAHRDVLRQNNRAFNARLKSKTRQFRRERSRGQPGTYQGVHVKSGECRCGGCNAGFVRTIKAA